MSATAWIVLALVAVVVIWAIAVYNRLVQLRNRIANAFGQIDVQLKRRYDLVPNLVEVARGYLAHEAATLEAVIKARGQAQGAAAAVRAAPTSAGAMGALAVAEQALGGSLGRLMMVAESYPELKAVPRPAAVCCIERPLGTYPNRPFLSGCEYNHKKRYRQYGRARLRSWTDS